MKNLEKQSKRFLEILVGVLGDERAALHEPNFDESEIRKVEECIRSGYVSSVGAFVTEFEQELKSITGSNHAIAVSSGTSALHISLMLAGVKPNDEVLVPTISFVATANAVVHANAIPHFVDSEETTLGMSPEKLREIILKLDFKNGHLYNGQTGRRVSAIVPMHTFGNPLELEEIIKIGEEFDLPIVEDSAESLGSFIGGRHTGTLGLLGILSFNGNKIVTTGGGGAILTNDDYLAERARSLTTTAKTPHPWKFHHDSVAWNYRLPNINAALGISQLKKLPSFLIQKKTLHLKYLDAFCEEFEYSLTTEQKGNQSNYWLNSVRLQTPDDYLLDAILETTNKAGFGTRPLWDPLHTLPMYKTAPRGDLTTSTKLAKSIVALPSSPFLATRT